MMTSKNDASSCELRRQVDKTGDRPFHRRVDVVRVGCCTVDYIGLSEAQPMWLTAQADRHSRRGLNGDVSLK